MPVFNLPNGVVVPVFNQHSPHGIQVVQGTIKGAVSATVTVSGSHDGVNFSDTAVATLSLSGAIATGNSKSAATNIPWSYYKSVVTSVSTPSVTGALALSVVAATKEYTRASGSFVTDGFFAGQTIIVANFATAGNNGTRVIASVAALSIVVLDPAGTMANETGSGDETMTGTVDPDLTVKVCIGV